MGKILISIGLLLILIGSIVILIDKIGIQLGKLPGDIYIKREHFIFFFPITTSILISIIISALLYLIKKFF